MYVTDYAVFPQPVHRAQNLDVESAEENFCQPFSLLLLARAAADHIVGIDSSFFIILSLRLEYK